MWLHPAQYALAPRIHEAKEQDEHEDTHLDQTEARVPLELSRPREDEDRFDVENHEEQGKDVVADLALRPSLAHRIDAALVGDQLLERRLVRSDECGNSQQQPGQEQGDGPEPDHGEVVAQELRHHGRRYYAV